jgi:hypothetical protein
VARLSLHRWINWGHLSSGTLKAEKEKRCIDLKFIFPLKKTSRQIKQ